MRPIAVVFALAVTLAACGSSDDGDAADTSSGASTPGDAETPPTGTATMLQAWLDAGSYRSWRCEPAPHAARPPSAHTKNRICSNALLSRQGDGPFPVGAAAVKELYDDAASKVVGYAVARKMSEGGGEGWWWFETTASGLVANGLGDSGRAKSVCVGCHAGAAHDQVFTQVK